MSFSCNASGNPTPKFLWTKNGSPINTTYNARISLSAGNKQLNITNVNRVDSGEYRCVANNSVGAVNSSAAFLTVQCKNTFTHLLTYFRICTNTKTQQNSLVVDITSKV